MKKEKEKDSSCHPYFYEIALIKGKLAVEKVLCSLRYFEQLNLIKSFGSSAPFSYDDCCGIDITIYPVWGGKILLQVKSSFNQEDKQRCEEKGIDYIVIPPSIEQEAVDEMVFELLIRDCHERIRKKRKNKR